MYSLKMAAFNLTKSSQFVSDQSLNLLVNLKNLHLEDKNKLILWGLFWTFYLNANLKVGIGVIT